MTQVDPFNHQSQITAKGDTPSPFFVRQWQNLIQLVRDTAAAAAAALAAQTTADAALPKALTSAHLFVGNSSNIATDRAMSGDTTVTNTGVVTIGANKVQESKLDLTDLTTFNATTGAHGFLKKLDNSAAHFMDGQGNWSTPAGTAASITVKDEGSNITTALASLNFVGSSVTATNSSDNVTVTITDSAGDISPVSDGGITKPAAADFTIADDTTGGHGTGSKTNLATRGVEFTHTLGAAATSQSMFYKAAVSSTLGAVTVYIAPNFQDTNGNHAYFYGIGVRDNTGKIDSYGLVFDSGVGNAVWYHATFTNISTAPTLGAAVGGGHLANGRPIWLRLAKVSTNFVFSASFNGETYAVITTVSATNFVGSTLNDVGVVLYNGMLTGNKILTIGCFSFVHT